MFKVFKSSKGLMDLQSVMVGVIVSAIVAGVAIVSIVGMVRLTAIDSGKSSLRVLTTGMESFYTENDRYPSSVTELANGDFIPKNYVQQVSAGTLCMIPGTGPYPQSYLAAVRIPATNDIFYANENQRTPQAGVSTSKYCLPS